MLNGIRELFKLKTYKTLFNKYFPIDYIVSYSNCHQRIKTKRRKLYFITLLNVELKNGLSKLNREFKIYISHYGAISLLLGALIVVVIGILKHKVVTKVIYNIVSYCNTPEWLSGIGTISAVSIALYPLIHHKSHVAMDVNVNSDSVSAQIMNMSDNDIFVKLDHIYMCDKSGQNIKPATDFSDYYGTYKKWTALKAHECCTFYMINRNKFKDSFNKMREQITNTNDFYGNDLVCAIKLVFSINDHYEPFIKIIDMNRAVEKLHS